MSEPASHPDDLLAGYVDGSASDQERRAVDDHLSSCATCRQEVALAASAHAALSSLPDLDAPGLAEQGLDLVRSPSFTAVGEVELRRSDAEDAARQDEASRIDDARERRRRRLARVGWASGLGAAAALIVLFGFLVTGGGSPGSLSTGAPAAAPAGGANPRAAESLPAVIERQADYSPSTVNALANDLAAGLGVKTSPPPAPQQPVKASQETPSRLAGSVSTDQSLAPAALTCLLGGGAPRTPPPFYLEAGSFQGMLAYIGAFRTAGTTTSGGSLLVIVVSRDGCQPLYEVRERIITP